MDRTSKPNPKGNRHVDQLSHVDHVITNAHSSQGEAQLYIYESPTRRHTSRTHRVGLDWLLDRINLDPRIQIKHVDTKEQLADMLAKSNFTRDEWNHLLRLVNIRYFSIISCSFSQFSFWFDQEAVRHVKERVQESDLKERLAVAKPKLKHVNIYLKHEESSFARAPGIKVWTRAGLRPQLETVCEGGRSIPSKGGS